MVMLLSACGGGKRLSRKDVKNTYTASQLANMTSSEAVKFVQQKQPAFLRAYAKKMSVSIDAFGRQMNVSATCKMVTDSAIHISIMPFFGIEMFKLEMTPTSMIIIDKANKRFFESNYGIFYEKLGVNINYDAIQSLISNRLFIPGKKVFEPEKFEWKNDTSRNVLSTQFDKIIEDVTVDFAFERIVELLFKTVDNTASLQTNYSGFSSFGNYVFPRTIRMELLTETQRSVLNFNIDDILFNENFEMKSTNLLRFTRADIRSFFKK